MSTPASLVLEFGEGVDSSDFIVKEFDPVRNVDADGKPKTSFIIPDDKSIYFLIHLGPGLAIEWIRPTNGMVSNLGSVRQVRGERCSFSFADESRSAELKYIPYTQPELYFYGNIPTVLPVRGRTLTVAGDAGLPGIADVSYKVNFQSFCLHVPDGLAIREGKSDYPIEIRIRIVTA